MEKIEFIASLPPIQSALSVSGDSNGARMKVDIPETELPQAIKLLLWRGKLFRLTAELIDDE